jgi:hypothetical protein
MGSCIGPLAGPPWALKNVGPNVRALNSSEEQSTRGQENYYELGGCMLALGITDNRTKQRAWLASNPVRYKHPIEDAH